MTLASLRASVVILRHRVASAKADPFHHRASVLLSTDMAGDVLAELEALYERRLSSLKKMVEKAKSA